MPDSFPGADAVLLHAPAQALLFLVGPVTSVKPRDEGEVGSDHPESNFEVGKEEIAFLTRGAK